MDWKAKVDLFEQLRREHEFGIGTIAGVAAKFGVHRRVVRRAIAGVHFFTAAAPLRPLLRATEPGETSLDLLIQRVRELERKLGEVPPDEPSEPSELG